MNTDICIVCDDSLHRLSLPSFILFLYLTTKKINIQRIAFFPNTSVPKKCHAFQFQTPSSFHYSNVNIPSWLVYPHPPSFFCSLSLPLLMIWIILRLKENKIITLSYFVFCFHCFLYGNKLLSLPPSLLFFIKITLLITPTTNYRHHLVLLALNETG